MHAKITVQLSTVIASTGIMWCHEPQVCIALLQADCGLSVAGATQTFASCSSLQGAGSEYSLLWTLEPASANGESVLSLAIESPSSGWVGWGIPTEAGEMVGASAVIVRADPASPTGTRGL